MLCCTCYSTENEYQTTVAFAAAGVTWIHSSLHELELNIPTTLVIYCDNPIFHSRMKHIAIDFTLFVIKFKVMLLASHVSSIDQLADVLAKPLLLQHLQQL